MKKINTDAGKETRELMNTLASNVDDSLKDALDGGSSLAPEIHTNKKEFSNDDIKTQLKTEEYKEPTVREIQERQETANYELQDFSPDIKLVGERHPEGLSSDAISRPKTIDQTGSGDIDPKRGRPATKIDISKLDETMIMSMPFIKTSHDIVPGILFLKPKDPTVRFRWVNYKNWEGGNYQRFRAIGFSNASKEDVDTAVTPVGDNCIEGTEIKWYDVILMKINVFVLMSLYKGNILSALQKVGRFQENAMSEAQRQFNEDIYSGLVEGTGPHAGGRLLTAYKRMKAQGMNIEFYVPGLDEKSDRDFISGVSDEDFLSGRAVPNR